MLEVMLELKKAGSATPPPSNPSRSLMVVRYN